MLGATPGTAVRIMALGDSISTCCHFCAVLPGILPANARYLAEPAKPYSGYIRRLWHLLDNATNGGGAHQVSRQRSQRSLVSEIPAISPSLYFEFVGRVKGCMINRSTEMRVPSDWAERSEGYYGYTTERLLREIVVGAMEAGDPDIVLLHIGTNDLIALTAPAGRRVENAINNILGILKRIAEAPRASGTPRFVILARIIPVRFGVIGGDRLHRKYAGKDYRVPQFNGELDRLFGANTTTTSSPTNLPFFFTPTMTVRQLMERRGQQAFSNSHEPVPTFVRLVDFFSGFSVAADLHGDGLHPNEEGEMKIARRFLEGVRWVVRNLTGVEFSFAAAAEPPASGSRRRPSVRQANEERADAGVEVIPWWGPAACLTILVWGGLGVWRFCARPSRSP